MVGLTLRGRVIGGSRSSLADNLRSLGPCSSLGFLKPPLQTEDREALRPIRCPPGREGLIRS
eukprot:9684119-Alexandrium_andersonii.AAC.1